MTMIVATLCPEGIAMAADSKVTAMLEGHDEVSGMKIEIPCGFSPTTRKIFVTDNNVAIALSGCDKIRGRSLAQFLREHLKAHPGLNARQVAEEVNGMLVREESVEDVSVLVAGLMEGRSKVEDGKRVLCKKPVVYELSTEERGKVRKHNKPCVVWKGEGDILMRLMGKDVEMRQGRKRVVLVDYQTPFELFSIRDAVAFSRLCVETTIKVMRFQERIQSVGEPIDVVTITENGAEWVGLGSEIKRCKGLNYGY